MTAIKPIIDTGEEPQPPQTVYVVVANSWDYQTTWVLEVFSDRGAAIEFAAERPRREVHPAPLRVPGS